MPLPPDPLTALIGIWLMYEFVLLCLLALIGLPVGAVLLTVFSLKPMAIAADYAVTAGANGQIRSPVVRWTYRHERRRTGRSWTVRR